MQTIKVDLPETLKTVHLVPLSDAHIGDPHANEQAFRGWLRFIAETPNAYCVLNGDLLNNAIKSSVSDVYNEVMSPMEQMVALTIMLRPISDRILCLTRGNHERRTMRESGVDIMRLVARELGIEDRYSPGMAYVFLRFGETEKSSYRHRKQLYTMLVTHGSRGGRKDGGKLNALEDLVSIADADLYLMGHSHQAMVVPKAYTRVDHANSKVKYVDRLFVNSGAFLEYGGYGEDSAFDIPSLAKPTIELDGTRRRMVQTMVIE